MAFTFKIVDSKNRSFKVSLSVMGRIWTFWQAKDRGFIRYAGGELTDHIVNGTWTEYDVFLHEPKPSQTWQWAGGELGNTPWGIVLYKIEDFWGLNKKGEGYVVQPWVLGLESGPISWVRV